MNPANPFAHNLFIKYPIVFVFYTEHHSDTVVLSAKFQNDWTTETGIMDERDFVRFEIRTDILYCTAPQGPLLLTWFNFNPSMDK